MIFFLYACWEITFSVALYNMIWAAALWQLLVEVWKVTQFLGAEAFSKSVLLETMAMMFLFLASYIICIKTIAKWMPIGRKERLGPRQMSLSLLLFVIINMLSFHERIGGTTFLPHEWGYFYLTDLAAFWGYNGTADALYIENIPENLVVSAKTESGQIVVYTPYREGGTTENTYNQ